MNDDKRIDNENLEEEIKTEEVVDDQVAVEKEAESIEDVLGEDDNLDVDSLMESYDKEASKLRKLKGAFSTIVMVIAIAMSSFHLYTAGFGTLLSYRQRSLHIIFAFIIGLFLYPARKKSSREKPAIFDFLLMGVAIVVFGYIFLFPEQMAL
ncbi:MAG TPA: C4-dicarboxylate ABC transporter permease, partial [Tissierellaceae bacterium]|nr:C4-dicarboxylate ABC transporter permease [Tissierellaceae bacterium]